MWVVIQEGGSSVELYEHHFYKLEEAEAFRYSCAEGAYATTEPVLMPDDTDMNAVEELLQALPTLAVLDRPDDEDEDDEDEDE